MFQGTCLGAYADLMRPSLGNTARRRDLTYELEISTAE